MLSAYDPTLRRCAECGRRNVYTRRGRALCDDCKAARNPRPTKRAERRRQIVDTWLASDTLEEAGQKLGITRERVRQILDEELPPWYVKLHRQRQRARIRQRHFVATATIVGGAPCVICGKLNSRPQLITCGHDCATKYAVLRVHIDDGHLEGQRVRHRDAVARWQLEHGTDETQVRFARRWLARESVTRGRWLVPGSQAHRYATEAYEKRWPIFDRLPAQIQQQIRGGGHLFGEFLNDADPSFRREPDVSSRGLHEPG